MATSSEETNRGGRPPFYKTPEQMQEAIDDYFANPPTKGIATKDGIIQIQVPTISGLALHLGFCDRQSMFDYSKKPEFSCTIKSAKSRIEQHYEQNLNFNNVAGSIFALKNLGWKDKDDTPPEDDSPEAGVINYSIVDCSAQS